MSFSNCVLVMADEDFYYGKFPKIMEQVYEAEDYKDRIFSEINFSGRVLFAYNWTTYHYKNGCLHRTDGPAISNNIKKKKLYYVNNKHYLNPEEWFEALTENQKIQALFNVNEWRNK